MGLKQFKQLTAREEENEMFKSRMKILLVSLSMVLLMATAAWAILGWPICYWCGSICVDSLLKGVPSLNKYDGIVRVEIQPTSGTYQCVNPADNSAQAKSHNFDPDAPIISGETLDTEWLDISQGKVLAKNYFSDDVIKAALACAFCPNCNWTIVDYDITALNYDVFLIFGDAGTCNLDDQSGCVDAEVWHMTGCTRVGEGEGAEYVCDDASFTAFDWKKAIKAM
jgi:hypothetical protein